MGQAYSHHVQVGDVRLWQHRDMIPRQDVEELFGLPIETNEELDRYLRGIFRRVSLDIFVRPQPVAPGPTPARTLAKVVEIRTGKKRLEKVA